ncbi:MAG TPA: DUF1559 domain-containing protein [Planctomycetaceae bacterium]|nr:DUF1559 domain-containing protein [Planctomycetaceae bacterium]
MTDLNTTPQGCSRGFVITVTLVFMVAIALVAPAIQQAREAARRTQSHNNLKQIGLALHNYHDNFHCFPPGGVFNSDGVAFHCWTSSIAPYLDASPWYNMVDFNVPWDDPRQVDLFRDFVKQQSHIYTNPSVSPGRRKDGLVFNHYAGSQGIFYRNSSTSLRRGVDPDQLLVADALGNHIPVGFPYAWRDVTLGFMTNLDGFGCRPRKITQCLMADGRVEVVAAEADAKVMATMAGPSRSFPKAEQVARLHDYPQIDISRIWRYEWIWSGKTDDFTVRRTSPTGEVMMEGRGP